MQSKPRRKNHTVVEHAFKKPRKKKKNRTNVFIG